MNEHAGGQRGGPVSVSRREAMKRALRTGAYAAPVILSLSAVAPVAAQTTPAPTPTSTPVPTPTPLLCTQPVTFLQDALLLGVAPGAVFDIYAQASNASMPTKVTSFTADRLGVAMTTFPLTLNTGAVTNVTLTVFLAPTAPPAPAAATFVSTLVASLACTAGGARAGAQLVAKVVQEPTVAACTSVILNQWQEHVDAILVNAQPNTAYDIYIAPNVGLVGAVNAGTLMTNGQGNAGAILPITVNTGVGFAPTLVQVVAVLAGAPPTSPAFTFAAAPTGTIATSTLLTLNCAGAVTSFGLTRPQLTATR